MPRRNQERSESSYIIHAIIPRFEELGYPHAGDHESVRVNDVPVYRPSGGRSGSTMDIVYYHNGEPLLLVESKRRHKSHVEAIKEAKNYLRNFPKEDSEFAASGKAPQYIATTVGGEIKFYKHWFDIESGQLAQRTEELRHPLTFDELVAEYGLEPKFVPKKLTPADFREKFLNELISVFVFDAEEGVTPEVITNIVQLILVYLQYPNNYTNQSPYVDLQTRADRQRHIRDLFRRYDLIGSLGPEIASEFRDFVLRAFQGSSQLNQYITPWPVIVLMTQLVEMRSEDNVLDFECGSGGFIVAAVQAGAPLQNVRGVDVADLPYYVSKLFLALNFSIYGKGIDTATPVYNDNGLYFQGSNWSVVIGNPAGGAEYALDDLEKVYEEGIQEDLDINGRPDSRWEYNFSVQQAVRSAKIGGRICLVLPEGFFSNSSADFLRRYVAKHCNIKAIISLPRGVFYKGTTTRRVQAGRQSSQQKMSILFVEKIREVVPGEGLEINVGVINYPVFLAAVQKPDNVGDNTAWLNEALSCVLKNYRKWGKDGAIIEESEVLRFIETKKLKKTTESQGQKVFDVDTGKKTLERKPKKPPTKEETIIPKNLEDLFS